jgi:cytoskeletal protein RodZ
MVEKDERPQPKQMNQSKAKKKRPKRPKSISLLVKWSIILVCLFVAGVGGLIVGYSVVGDGPASEVLSLKIWKHIYDLAFGS